MKTELAISHLSVIPGEQGSVSIDVVNNADVIDGVTAIVDGINPDWIRLERPVVSLFPDSSDQLELIFDIPKECPAGDYLVIVRIVSTIEADRQSVHDFWLTVEPQPGLEIELRPSIVSGGLEATITATVVNTGNAPIDVTVEALEPNVRGRLRRRSIGARHPPGRRSADRHPPAWPTTVVRRSAGTHHPGDGDGR